MYMFDYYMTVLRDRDQALLFVGIAVCTGMVWWQIGRRWPRVRRWVAWGIVASYVALAYGVVIGV